MPEAADDNAPGHPTAGIFLLLFKGGAMAYYIVCGLLPFNFVLNFCIVTFLLVCDFWTVSIYIVICSIATDLLVYHN